MDAVIVQVWLLPEDREKGHASFIMRLEPEDLPALKRILRLTDLTQ